MSDVDVTLVELFPIDKAAVQQAIKVHLRGAAPGRAELLGPILGVVTDRAVASLNEALHVDLVGLAAETLSGLRELHDYSGADKPPAGAEAVVTFFDRILKAPLTLGLHLEVDHAKLPPLELTLDLRLVFEALAVTVKAGRVRGVGLGSGHAEASVRYGDEVLVPLFSSRPLELPPKAFDPGFAIP